MLVFDIPLQRDWIKKAKFLIDIQYPETSIQYPETSIQYPDEEVL